MFFRDVLDQVYKLHVRPLLDYGDIIYHKFDQDTRGTVTKSIEQAQYTAALAVTGAWKGTSRQNIYEELGWESMYDRRWYQRLCHFSSQDNKKHQNICLTKFLLSDRYPT